MNDKIIKSYEDYLKATELELVESLIESIKELINNTEKYLIDLNKYKKEKKCGTYRCLAGWMGYWAGMDNRSKEFKKIFKIYGIYHSFFTRYGVTWGDIFGVYGFGSLKDRLKIAETLKDRIIAEGGAK